MRKKNSSRHHSNEGVFKLKKTLCILGICGAAALTGCANNMADSGPRDVYEESGFTVNRNNQQPELYNRGGNNTADNFGYVRHQRSPVIGENNSDHYAAINREQLADIIGQYCTEVPDVDDVSTLVTDEEVLIVYDTDTQNRNETADQVKKMAMSVVPRWYHVYVSDNTSLRPNVANFASLDPNSANMEAQINGVIKQMLQSSPQGRKISDGENANGEAQGEMNDNMDHDDLGEMMEKSGQTRNRTQNDASNNNTGSDAGNRTGNETGIQGNDMRLR